MTNQMADTQHNLFDTDPAPWELDDAAQRAVAEVVFGEPPHGPYSYRVPERLRAEVTPGRRVRAPLGAGNRPVDGYCVRVDTQPVGQRPLKELMTALDDGPLLSANMLRLCEWMADYYLCELGQAIEAAAPASVREAAGTREVTYLTVPSRVTARLATLVLPEKQLHALRLLAASAQPLTPAQLARAAQCSVGPIHALRKLGLVKAETRREASRDFEAAASDRELAHNLNADQQTALDAVLETVRAGRPDVLLLHGVTGSGKTEVYMRAIDETLRFGRQAIMLVPEISLTPQTLRRFRARFDNVAVLHSHLSPAERHWHWARIARGEADVVVGARSAVFAPAPRLGLIVIDEEHDASFKQDSAPRYHAREVAAQRCRAVGAPLVLGSATPSLESWRAAQTGAYRLLELPLRVMDRPLPDVAAIDLRAEFQNRRSRGAVSRQLHQAIHQALQADGQVILLLNRRGYSTTIQCPACGHVVKCPECDIALTHHRDGEKAMCHYCDFQIAAPPECPECRSNGIRYSGLGTERLEAEIRARFPHTPCLRMDSDSMKKPGSHEEALRRFREGEIKILLGTQMIAKGLDFPNVTLVGVVNADMSLHFPDFRAAERTFQLVTQVAGRSGRGEKGGRVLVQTFSPEHPAIQAALRHDFVGFSRQEMENRREYGYPPLARMARLIIKGPRADVTEQFAEALVAGVHAAIDRHKFEIRVLGPAEAPLAKLRGKHRFHVLMLGPEPEQLRRVLREGSAALKPPEEVQWVADVDPLDML